MVIHSGKVFFGWQQNTRATNKANHGTHFQQHQRMDGQYVSKIKFG